MSEWAEKQSKKLMSSVRNCQDYYKPHCKCEDKILSTLRQAYRRGLEDGTKNVLNSTAGLHIKASGYKAGLERAAEIAEIVADDIAVQVINGKVEMRSTKEFIQEKIAVAIRKEAEDDSA